MSFWQIIVLVIIPSGIVGAITSGLVAHFSNKKLDFQQRTMERRKEVYGKVQELFQGLYSTATKEESSKTKVELLKHYREVQIWGSDEVVRKFTELLKAIDLKSGISQKDRNFIYKEFIIVMRKDILNQTRLSPEEIEVYGKID